MISMWFLSTGYAEIYKCNDEGRTSFQERPCKGSKIESRPLPSAGNASKSVSAQLSSLDRDALRENAASAQTRRDMTALRRAAITSAETLHQNINKAALTQQRRDIDRSTERKLLEIELEKRQDLKRLEMDFPRKGDKYWYMVGDITQDSARKTQAIYDSARDEKSAAEAKLRIRDFDAAIAKATECKEQMESIARKITAPSVSDDSKKELITQFSDAKTDMEEYIQLMKNARNALINEQTSMGKPVVPTHISDQMQKKIEDAVISLKGKS